MNKIVYIVEAGWDLDTHEYVGLFEDETVALFIMKQQFDGDINQVKWDWCRTIKWDNDVKKPLEVWVIKKVAATDSRGFVFIQKGEAHQVVA
jgi:hypothetical protein